MQNPAESPNQCHHQYHDHGEGKPGQGSPKQAGLLFRGWRKVHAATVESFPAFHKTHNGNIADNLYPGTIQRQLASLSAIIDQRVVIKIHSAVHLMRVKDLAESAKPFVVLGLPWSGREGSRHLPTWQTYAIEKLRNQLF